MMWLLLVGLGCGGPTAADDSVPTDPDTETDTDTDTDTDADADTDADTDTDVTTEPPMPEDPTPFTVTVSGAASHTLVFDLPGCSWYDGIPNFRQTWRNAAGDHVFVLIADVRGSFTGPGTYDQTASGTAVKLQEEAGGSASYFATDVDAGDTLGITVEHASEVEAFGSFTFSGLHDSAGGAVSVAEQPLPIWCPTMND